MEYESYKQHLESLSQGIASAVLDWSDLSSKALPELESACAGEAVDIHGLRDVKASFAAEATFLKGMPDRIEEYREQIRGLRRFYEPTEQAATILLEEEPAKGGWLFGKKRQQLPSAVEPPPQVADIHRDQRAFNDARALLSELDQRLDALRELIAKAIDESEEVAYGYKSEVVALNGEIRSASQDVRRKKEARRFFLEEAVGILSERATQLGLHSRVIGRLHSSEYIENPFED
jgi:hypothetical protein